MIRKILQAVFIAAAFATTGLAAAAPVGYVHEVKGDVTLRDAGKAAVKAGAGATFEQGANITTGADGQVTLKFEDGQIAILAPNAQFIVTTYSYNKSRVADSNIVFNLARGGLRFVSGIIAETNRSKFAIRTPTATAGVRGTDGQVVVSADGSVTASTSAGIVTLTVGGTIFVLNQGQFTSTINGVTSPPAAVSTMPPAMAAVAALIRAVAAVNSPPNNPISVAATANAVGAAVRAQTAAAAFQAAVARGAPQSERDALQTAANNANVLANQTLQTAATANQTAIQQAIAGGAAPGAGTNPGGAAPAGVPAGTTPPLTSSEVQLLQPLVPVVPCVPSAPATTC